MCCYMHHCRLKPLSACIKLLETTWVSSPEAERLRYAYPIPFRLQPHAQPYPICWQIVPYICQVQLSSRKPRRADTPLARPFPCV